MNSSASDFLIKLICSVLFVCMVGILYISLLFCRKKPKRFSLKCCKMRRNVVTLSLIL